MNNPNVESVLNQLNQYIHSSLRFSPKRQSIQKCDNEPFRPESWVPNPIREVAEDLIGIRKHGQLIPEQSHALKQLLTDPGMEKVWNRMLSLLEKDSEKDKKLRCIFRELVSFAGRWCYVERASQREQLLTFKKAEKQIRKLLDTISNTSCRRVLYELAMPLLIVDLQQAAEAFSKAMPWSEEPSVYPMAADFTKRNTTAAGRTYYIRETSLLMRKHFNQPLHSVVAAIASAIFSKDEEDGISESLVAKLTSGL